MIDSTFLARMLRARLTAHAQAALPGADPVHVADAVESVLADAAAGTGRPVLDFLRSVNFLELVRLVLELIRLFQTPTKTPE